MPDAQDQLTRTGWVVGTAGYMSPEQIRGQQPDRRSDLYALGCVVFEALTGQRPFSGDNDLAVGWAHANSPRPVASAICPALGPSYDAFLARALAVDPRDRFQSGREFAAALRSAHVRQPDTGTQLPASPAPTRVSFGPSFQPPPGSTPAAGVSLIQWTGADHMASPAAANRASSAHRRRHSSRGGTSGNRAGGHAPTSGRCPRAPAQGWPGRPAHRHRKQRCLRCIGDAANPLHEQRDRMEESLGGDAW